MIHFLKNTDISDQLARFFDNKPPENVIQDDFAVQLDNWSQANDEQQCKDYCLFWNFRETEHIFFSALICIAISSDLARFFDDDGPEIEFKVKNEDGKNIK